MMSNLQDLVKVVWDRFIKDYNITDERHKYAIFHTLKDLLNDLSEDVEITEQVIYKLLESTLDIEYSYMTV